MRHNLLLAFGLVLAGVSTSFPQSLVPLNPVPSRIVGHPQAEQLSVVSPAPNLVEGRELMLPQGIAVDTSVAPNILYVSDTGNNRVLAWKNAAGFTNGQPADLVIGQQDFYRTTAQGPGAQYQTGLNSPTGIAVDPNGNLYVVDTGNNRILRFPKPFATQGNLFPDLYIGQPNLNSRVANYTGTVAAQGIWLASGSVAYRSNVAFDSAGNLWITDPLNRRVLRFSSSDVAAGGGPLQPNLELGQLDFSSVQPGVTNATRTTLSAFAIPSGLAFDSNGYLYVSDADATPTVSRVLVFKPPFTNGMSASRLMGVFPPNQPATTQDQLQRSIFGEAEGIFFAGTKLGIVDDVLNRILLFETIDKWPSDVNVPPQATAVVGQPDFSTVTANSGPTAYSQAFLTQGWGPPSTPATFAGESAAAFAGQDLYVADTVNNRALDLPFIGYTFSPATRVLGQDRFDMRAENLIEGREFNFLASTTAGTLADAGLALDTGSGTPHLYVADPYNNRVLGFNDYRSLKYGAKADIVIGQQDFNSGLCNQTGDPNHRTQTSLCRPVGVLVDAAGNLYVADSGNSRVLRFPAPFNNTTQQADLVLGQKDFTTQITDPSSTTMSQPYGLAFAGNVGLLVSDTAHNRVLYFAFTAGGTFRAGTDNGLAATKVLGQPNFITASSGSTDDKLNAPHHISTDSEARPYVADSGNNRVVIFDQILNDYSSGQHASLLLNGLTSPRSVFANQATGELWVGDTTSTVKKYPKFETLVFNQASTGSVSSASATLALVQDPYGDLVLADATNRVAIYYPGLQAINGASFLLNRQLAPGMFASVCSPGSNCDPNSRLAIFGTATQSNTSLPLATNLGDVQVLVNGVTAPLTYVSPTQINFIVPMATPSSGTADLQVVQASTGRVYASGIPQMNTYSPAMFMLDFNTADRNRQAAVLNQDNTVNSTTNCATRGSYIQIFATGQGFLSNAPPDGSAPTGLVTTPFTPHMNIGGQFVEEYARSDGEVPQGQEVYFSGLSPQFPGLWQINVYIPKGVAPAPQTPIAIFINSLSSVDFASSGWVTTICVK
jgi:uncharacterized protein (TIGR03437 family)